MPIVLIKVESKPGQENFPEKWGKFPCPSSTSAAVILHLQVKNHAALEMHVISIRQLFDSRLPIFHFHAQLLRQVDAGITFERLDVLGHVIKASNTVLCKEKAREIVSTK